MLRRALGLLQERLPPGWRATVAEQVAVRDRRVDAVVELTGSDGSRAVLVVEAKRSVVVRDLPAVVDQLRVNVADVATPGTAAVPVVAARTWLQAQDISYADATGNLRIVVDTPALFMRDAGADRDPWRGPGRSRASLQGPPAARIVRALVDFAPPVSVPELVRRSGASTGATYRVVEFLQGEALLEREPRGPILATEWRRVLERWSEDYGFQRSNTVGAYLQPRGIAALLDDLRAPTGRHYAVTGSLAAQRLAPYAPPRLAMLYVDEPAEVVEELGLRAVDAGANVLLAAGDYDVVFDRTVEADGLTFVAPSQTAVDLLTGPGRSPAEAQALLDWMQTHESDWRR